MLRYVHPSEYFFTQFVLLHLAGNQVCFDPDATAKAIPHPVFALTAEKLIQNRHINVITSHS